MFQVSGPEKSAKGKIILIITPARRCSHLCLPYVCLFVCLLVGDRPSPVFSILPCFFYRPAGSITVEYGIRRSIWQIRELLRLPNFLIRTAAAHTLHAKMQSFSAFLFAPSIYLLRCSRLSRFSASILVALCGRRIYGTDECQII